MSDRRPSLWRAGHDDDEMDDCQTLTHAVPATSADILAVVRRGVESGTIKGKVLWMIPESGHDLRGTLWAGPPTDGHGLAVLVIPVSDGGSET